MWWLTFRQFAALTERHQQSLRRQDLRFGVVAAVIANVNRDTKKKSTPFTPFDFFPEPGEATRANGLPKPSVEALKAEFMAAGHEVRSRSEEGVKDGGA